MLNRRFIVPIGAFLVAVLGSPGASALGRTASPMMHRSGGWTARDANTSDPWLYTAGYYNNVVNVYDLADASIPLIETITDGVDGPAQVAVDANGAVYVANQSAGNVTIYLAGTTSPSLTLSQGLTDPLGIAIDSAGNVYVSNRSPNYIVVYAPGQTTPTTTLSSDLFYSLGGMFFDSTGTLYISDNVSGVLLLPPGSQQPYSLGLQGLTQTGGIALGSRGDLFVGDLGYDHKVYVFAPGQVKAKRKLAVSLNADFLASGPVKGVDYIFVPNFFSNTVSLFKQRGRNPVTTLTTASSGVNGVAYKPAGVP
jgi:streptogramin lyase